MTNILKKTTLERQSAELSARLLMGVSAGLSLAAIVLALSIAPAYVSVRAETSALTLEMQQTKAATSRDGHATLAAAKKRVTALSDAAASGAAGDAITRVLADRDAAITVTSIQYSHATDGTGTLVVSGTAKTRQSVQSYVATLQSERLFTNVNIPVSSLTTSEAGKFDINISGTF